MMGRAIISILFFLIGANVTFAQTVSIADPNLRAAIENTLGKAPGATITEAEMEGLTELRAPNVGISDLTGLETALNLQRLYLGHEYVSAEGRFINNNTISDLTPLSGLTQLTLLDLNGNAISEVTALSGLTNLVVLWLGSNVITDITGLSGLTNLVVLRLWDNNISDISPLVSNRGLGAGEVVSVSENPLNDISITVHIPALQDRGVEVHFSNLKPPREQFLLSVPMGYSLIHVPLRVKVVDGVAHPIESVADLYDALGGAAIVKLVITLDSQTQQWYVYLSPLDRGTDADRELTDEMGILVDMRSRVKVHLAGIPLATDGDSTISLTSDYNLVGLPLRDEGINRVSDLFTLEGIGGNSAVVFFTDNGAFKVNVRGEGPNDMPIIGGQAFILDTRRSATVTLSGEGWYNTGR